MLCNWVTASETINQGIFKFDLRLTSSSLTFPDYVFRKLEELKFNSLMTQRFGKTHLTNFYKEIVWYFSKQTEITLQVNIWNIIYLNCGVICNTGLIRLSEKSFVLFIQYPPDEGLRTSKCNLRHLLQVTPLLIFGAKRKWKPFKRDKSTSRDFAARSAASRPKQRTLRGMTYSIPLRGLTYFTLKFMRSTCGKSKDWSS